MNRLGGRALYLVLAACGMCAFVGVAEARVNGPETEASPFTLAAKAGGKEGYCRSYAKRAVAAQKQNQRNDCGFRGGRWQSNSNNHYQWCLRVPRRRAEAESRNRQRLLQDCRRGSTRRGNEGYCRSYAKRAVNAHKQNQRQGCGFGGARWHSNSDRHYRWCLRVSRRHAENESNARKRQLQNCR